MAPLAETGVSRHKLAKLGIEALAHAVTMRLDPFDAAGAGDGNKVEDWDHLPLATSTTSSFASTKLSGVSPLA